MPRRAVVVRALRQSRLRRSSKRRRRPRAFAAGARRRWSTPRRPRLPPLAHRTRSETRRPSWMRRRPRSDGPSLTSCQRPSGTGAWTIPSARSVPSRGARTHRSRFRKRRQPVQGRTAPAVTRCMGSQRSLMRPLLRSLLLSQRVLRRLGQQRRALTRRAPMRRALMRPALSRLVRRLPAHSPHRPTSCERIPPRPQRLLLSKRQLAHRCRLQRAPRH